MQVTNGKVLFSRKVKPADYEGAECAVELSFLIEEGDDPAVVTNTVARMAQEQALERLGRKTQVAPATPLVGNKEAAAANLNAADKSKPGRPPKAAAKPADPPKSDPAAVTGNDTDPEKSAEAMKAAHAASDAASVVEEGDDAILGGDSVPEVTDKMLTDAITRKNAALQKTIGTESPKKIRAMIAKYAGPVPKQSRDIPMAVRQKFLGELEVLA